MSHHESHSHKLPWLKAFSQQMVELVAVSKKHIELTKEFRCHETSFIS